MESKSSRVVATVPARKTALVGMLITVMICFITSPLLADGKLRRVSSSARKHAVKDSPKPATKNQKQRPGGSRQRNPSNENDSDRHESGHDDRNHASNRRKIQHGSHRRQGRSRSSGFFFVSAAPHCPPVIAPCPASRVVSAQPIIVSRPSSIEAPYPVYDSAVVLEETSIIAQPEFVPDETPLVEQVVFPEPDLGSDWFQSDASRIWAQVGSDFDGITNGGLGLHLQDYGGLGLESSVMTLRESTEAYRDHLWIGDVNLVYEVLARGDVRGRIGLGVNWLSDAWGGEAGFNLTAGFDFRLSERTLLSAEGDLGSLGDADYLHGRLHLARRFERTELMLGVDHFDIGGAVITSFFTGVQFHF